MRDRIRTIHLHDNDGSSDLRLAPLVDDGGTLDWPVAAELLAEHANLPHILELQGVGEVAEELRVATESLNRLEELFANHG